ncbi:replicative helicase loader/inhibitor [Metabacillus iocasae]|uniref:Replicative helicase inhibitor G39P N-terminal domain-containing protein n=1 Tax=Priestia iocasae TaxID=2291674 RepID=A0ABS2QSF1_9BACI|nr:replicative helicase loader/inhibitor [Metabacillus iocasae]MBM7702320.1 hypothetical protein [Metabacillus iocasae]
MTPEQAYEIISKIAVMYDGFKVEGEDGKARLKIWMQHLRSMPYAPVSQNVDRYIQHQSFPPQIADIAAKEVTEADIVSTMKRWEEEVKAERQAGSIKQFFDYLPPHLQQKYAYLQKEKNQ